MDVRLPDGTVVQNVPDGISKADLATKLQANGMTVPPAWLTPPPQQQEQPHYLSKALSTLGNAVGGPLEGAAHIGSQVGSGLLGGMGFLSQLATNGGNADDAKNFSDKVQKDLTYQPRSTWGKQIAGASDSIMSAPGRAIDATTDALQRNGIQDPEMAGNADMSDPGNTGTVPDALATALNVGAKAAPVAAGLRFKPAELPAADLPKAPAITPETVQSLKTARDNGLLVTPTQAGDSSTMGNIASMSGSETKLQQAMSRFNSGNKAPEIAAKDIGIEDGNLTPAAIAAKKAQANAVYEAAKKAPDALPDAKLVKDMENIGARSAAVDKQFPTKPTPGIKDLQDTYSPKVADGTTPGEYQPMNSEALVEAVKGLRSDAKALYTKGLQDPEAARMANATQRTADALDDFMQRSLVKNGQPNLAKAFVDARTSLAKIKSVEDAYNPTTGSVDVSSLAHDLDRGVPLSGGLKVLADSYKAFPKVFQKTERLPGDQPTILEQGSLVGAALHGNVPLALAALARPFARSRVMRPSYQDQMVNRAGMPPAPPVPPAIPGQFQNPGVAAALSGLGAQVGQPTQ